MFKLSKLGPAAALLALFFLSFGAALLSAQDSKVMGEVRFEGDTQLDRDSGVWIDGNYVGYVKELKGNKKVLLLPGKHQISVRQKGYADLNQDIVVEPGEAQSIQVSMHLLPGATTPDVTSELKITVQPKRAAVFLDGSYVGHASELGGRFHSLLVSPGKHRIKIELPGYRTFETDVNVLAGQKSEVKSELVKGSIEQADTDIKKP
ncbi:MAG: PEGA domain-containing protein [Candidatus Acidiferrum sp.]